MRCAGWSGSRVFSGEMESVDRTERAEGRDKLFKSNGSLAGLLVMGWGISRAHVKWISGCSLVTCWSRSLTILRGTCPAPGDAGLKQRSAHGHSTSASTSWSPNRTCQTERLSASIRMH